MVSPVPIICVRTGRKTVLYKRVYRIVGIRIVCVECLVLTLYNLHAFYIIPLWFIFF